MIVEPDGPDWGPAARAALPRGALVSGSALARDARAAAAADPAGALGRAFAAGPRDPDGPLVSELARDGDARPRWRCSRRSASGWESAWPRLSTSSTPTSW